MVKACLEAGDASGMRLLLTLLFGVALSLGAYVARPHVAGYLTAAGYLSVQEGDTQAAHAWIDRAVWLDGETADRASLRGSALLMDGDSARALAAFTEAIRQGDWAGEAGNQYARLTLALDRDTTGLAATLDETLQRCNTPDTRFTRALYRDHAGQPERKLDELDEALRLDPGDATSHVARGRTLAALGRDAEAAEAFRKGVEAAPTWDVAHVRRAIFHAERKDWPEVYETSLALARLHPEDPAEQRGVAASAYCLGDAEAARQALDRFVEMGGDLDSDWEPLVAFYRGEGPVSAGCDE